MSLSSFVYVVDVNEVHSEPYAERTGKYRSQLFVGSNNGHELFGVVTVISQ